MAMYAGFFCILALLMVYFTQDKMLYIPDAPNQAYRYPENNPKSYRNPGERNMLFEEVSVRTSDGLVLKGWFVK
jgi:hypothetical protein